MRTLITTDGKLVLVYSNPNKGYVYGIFSISGKVMTLDMMSHANLYRDLIAEMHRVYGENPGWSATTPVRQVGEDVEIAKDASQSLTVFGEPITPLAEKDINSLALADFICSNFIVKFKLVDYDNSPLEDDNKIVYDSAAMWAKIPAELVSYFTPDIDKELYREISSTPLFKRIVKYLEAKNPIEEAKNILLKGPKATGKTKFVEAIAKHFNMPRVVFTCTRTTITDDLIKHDVPNENGGGWKTIATPLSYLLRSGGIVLFDEINLTPGDVQTNGFNPMLDGSRQVIAREEVIMIPPGTIVFGAMNEGYRFTEPLNEATENRFFPVHMPPIPLESIRNYHSTKFDVDPSNYERYLKAMKDIAENIVTSFQNENTMFDEVPTISERDYSRIFVDARNNQGDLFSAVKSYVDGVLSAPCFTSATKDALMARFEKTLKDLSQVLFLKKKKVAVDRTEWESLKSAIATPIPQPADVDAAVEFPSAPIGSQVTPPVTPVIIQTSEDVLKSLDSIPTGPQKKMTAKELYELMKKGGTY